jgi:hypothetical protein
LQVGGPVRFRTKLLIRAAAFTILFLIVFAAGVIVFVSPLLTRYVKSETQGWKIHQAKVRYALRMGESITFLF